MILPEKMGRNQNEKDRFNAFLQASAEVMPYFNVEVLKMDVEPRESQLDSRDLSSKFSPRE